MIIPALTWLMLLQAPAAPLGGTVTGPDGAPIVGADLILTEGSPAATVLGRSRSGPGGRFALERRAMPAGASPEAPAAWLWVVHPGHRLGTIPIRSADAEVAARLEPPGAATVRVLGPEGRPAVGVRILPGALIAPYRSIPDAVADLIAATTGPDGRAVLTSLAAAELTYVDVHTPDLGIQGLRFAAAPAAPPTINLRPAANWAGRLKAADPADARGWGVRAWARVGGFNDPEVTTAGYVETTTDADGRFALRPIALGSLTFEFKPPRNRPVMVDPPQDLVVRADSAGEVEIPLRATSTVTGRFVEAGTGRPVPGVQAHLIPLGTSRSVNQPVTTDEQGRYTFRALPGLVRVGHFRVPPTHIEGAGQGWEDFTVPDQPRVIELADRTVGRAAPPLRGRVVDEAGRAVAGAGVVASWQVARNDNSAQATADDRGEFTVGSIPPDVTVRVAVTGRTRASVDPVVVPAGDPRPLTIEVRPKPVFAAAVRIVGTDGLPVVGVTAQVRRREPRDDGRGFAQPVWFEGRFPLRSGPDGAFRSPAEIDRTPGEFQVEVTDVAFLPARTGWLATPTDGELLTFPDLAVGRAPGSRAVAGRVLDRAGRPVAGAVVRPGGIGPDVAPARADDSGSFQLRRVPTGPAFVVAEAAGFRRGGTMVGAGDDPVAIRLDRVDEPPTRREVARPAAPTRAEERALAVRLLEPLVPLARARELGALDGRVLPALARVDPERVLGMIEDRVVGESQPALINAALAQDEGDPAQADATLGATQDPSSRAAGWLALADARPDLGRPRRVALLDRALADARLAEPAEVQVGLLGQVAAGWLALGDRDRARPALEEGRRILAANSKQWFFNSEGFAEALATIDLPAAEAIFERRGRTNVSAPDAATIARHRAAAAGRLAPFDPATAERLLGPSSDQYWERPAMVLEVARRLAVADLPRARRLLDLAIQADGPAQFRHPALRDYGLGRLAGEVAGSDPAAARRLLDEAFDGLQRRAAEDRSGWPSGTSASNLMAELLPIVARADPDRLAERTWLAATFASPLPREPNASQLAGQAALAMLIGRFDREVAAVLAAPVLDRLPDVLAAGIGYGYEPETIVKELATLDARAIEPLIRRLPPEARRGSARPDDFSAASVEARVRLHAAELLGCPPAARPREAARVGMGRSPYRVD